MTPTNHNYFEENVRLFRAGQLDKIKRAPIRFLRAAILGQAARYRKSGIITKAHILTGDSMIVVLPEEVSTALYCYGFYEEGLTRMLIEQLKPGMTFFDVGAHFGYYSLLASNLVGILGRVHSFEPTPNTFSILKANAKCKNNININQVAVSSDSGIAQFNDLGLVFSGRNSLHRAKLSQHEANKNRPSIYTIQTTTIDQYCQEVNLFPDVIKIDAESAEFQILQGMEQTMKQKRPAITLEVGDAGIEGVPTSRELVEYLLSHGYNAYEFNAHGISDHAVRDKYDWDNLLFLAETV